MARGIESAKIGRGGHARGQVHLQIALEAQQGRDQDQRLGHFGQKGPGGGTVQQNSGTDHAAPGQHKRKTHLGSKAYQYNEFGKFMGGSWGKFKCFL